MSSFPTDRMLRAYYEEVHSTDVSKAITKTRQNILTEYLDQSMKYSIRGMIPEGDAALDLGGGTGENYQFLQNRFHKIVLTDISLRALLVARHISPEVLPVQADALKQPFRSSQFDFIILSEVIEHIHPDVSSELLAEIARLLHHNGAALITTPNGMEYRRLLLWWPVAILSYLTCVDEMRIASRLYQLYCKVTGYKTAKAELFKKYGFLEHINILTPQKLVRQGMSVGLIVESVRFAGVRPILSFPFKYSGKGVKALQHIDERWKVGRSFLCSGMYVLLRRGGAETA